MLWLVLLLVAMVAFSSYVRGAANRARAEAAGRRRFRVTVKLAGSGMATRAEMRQRLAIEEEIARRRIGAITDGGSGNGEMWIDIAAGESDTAEQQIREAVEAAGVGDRSTISPTLSSRA
jgi:hypothetical protein